MLLIIKTLNVIFGTIIIISITYSFNGCVNDHLADVTNKSTPVLDTHNVCYATDVVPILKLNCSLPACHDNGIKGRPSFSDYNQLIRNLSPGNADGSILYFITAPDAQELMPPLPFRVLSDNQRAVLKKWINSGAKDKCN